MFHHFFGFKRSFGTENKLITRLLLNFSVALYDALCSHLLTARARKISHVSRRPASSSAMYTYVIILFWNLTFLFFNVTLQNGASLFLSTYVLYG